VVRAQSRNSAEVLHWMRLSAQSILKLVADMQEQEAVEFLRSEKKIIRDAPMPELIASARVAPDAMSRQILSKILGRRCDPSAVDILIEHLSDPDPRVRTEAAEGLGNIGDARSGPALLQRYRLTAPGSVERHLVAFALGSVGYRPAITVLMEALQDPDSVLRDTAALALASLGAPQAFDSLRKLARQGTHSAHSRTLVNRAVKAVDLVAAALDAHDPRTAQPSLIHALMGRDSVLKQAAAWALGEVGGAEAKVALQHALDSSKASCPQAARIKEALASIDSREAAGKEPPVAP
jgi:HEAT repeat protein